MGKTMTECVVCYQLTWNDEFCDKCLCKGMHMLGIYGGVNE